MSVLELEFHDYTSGWHLNRMIFDQVNLLVGNSGVGKSRILGTLNFLKDVADGTRQQHWCAWNVKVKADSGDTYTWDMKRQTNDVTLRQEEIISLGDGEIVSRKPDAFHFNGQVLPQLKEWESAVSLLRDESSVNPLYTAMCSVMLSYGANTIRLLQNPEQFPANSYVDFDALRNAKYVPLLARAFAMQESFPDKFSVIANSFRSIFPSVTEVRIGAVALFNPTVLSAVRGMVTVGIKEDGVPEWVIGPDLSSGMFRTFVHLLEFELSPRGTIYLIDEVEDSLGVNCLGAVIDEIKQNSRDLQFVMTSHHPYIINNIKVDDWRIVTRKGSRVTVKKASEIPALSGQSRQEKFIRLINAPEFEDGIQ